MDTTWKREHGLCSSAAAGDRGIQRGNGIQRDEQRGDEHAHRPLVGRQLDIAGRRSPSSQTNADTAAVFRPAAHARLNGLHADENVCARIAVPSSPSPAVRSAIPPREVGEVRRR